MTKDWYTVTECELNHEFTARFKNFLQEINEKISNGDCLYISDMLCNSMSKYGIYYHTPAHILNIFQFAEDNKIELNHLEKMAIWYHDSIYFMKQKPGENEKASARFFSVFSHLFNLNFFNKDEELTIRNYICGTAHFLDKSSDLRGYNISEKVMDLDLHSFALPYEQFKQVAALVSRETGATPQQTIGFYNLLLARAPIFRTIEMRDNFESRAIENIETFIQEHS